MLRSISRLRLPHLRLSSCRRNLAGDTSDEDDVAVSVLPPRDPDAPPKLFVVQPRLRPEPVLEAKLSEALNLATSLEDRRNDDWTSSQEKDKSTPPHLVVQNPMARSSGRADKFFGPGTVDNVKCHLQALDSEDGPSAVFVNAILSGIQQRNLEIAWGKPVLDRIGLIIEIFNAHAQTKEAKLQSELAALMYRSTRLVRARGPSGRLTFGMSGEAEVVSAKGKGSGGRGFLSGAGESEIQLQRRRIQERRERLLHEIEEVRRTRALHRYARKRRGGSQGIGLATIAVVGYTNAGKSTLVSALSHSDLYRDDRLFATVDPRLRNVVLPSGRKALLSDTVGFISDLPIQLVEAFHATLEEVVDADLLVHVLDSSAKDLEEQRSTVLKVLQQIGVSEEKIQNMVEVWNKIDLLGEECEAIETPHEDTNLGEGKCGQGTFSSQDGNPLHTSVGDLAPEGLENPTAPNNFLDADGCLFHDENEHADSPIKSGDIEPELLSSEHMVDDDACRHESDSICWEQVDIVDSELPMDNNGLGSTLALVGESATCQPINVKRVETSATTRVGLQELLQAIDEKLNSPNSSETGNTAAIFERKWRPHSKNDKITSVH